MSVGPMLARPWREDVRLYYVHRPRFTFDSYDAWAILGRDGKWQMKVFR